MHLVKDQREPLEAHPTAQPQDRRQPATGNREAYSTPFLVQWVVVNQVAQEAVLAQLALVEGDRTQTQGGEMDQVVDGIFREGGASRWFDLALMAAMEDLVELDFAVVGLCCTILCRHYNDYFT